MITITRGTLWLLSRARWGDLAYKFRTPAQSPLPPIADTEPEVPDSGPEAEARVGPELEVGLDCRWPMGVRDETLTADARSLVHTRPLLHDHRIAV